MNIESNRIIVLLFFSDVLLYGCDELSPLHAAQENHLGRGVNQGETAELLVEPEDLPQLREAHPVPDVLDVLHHEVLHKEVVGAAGARDDVRKVGKLLDQDDAIIATGAEAT